MHDARTGQLKTAFIFPLFITAVAVLVGRLYNIQVQSYEFFADEARKQSETTIRIAAARGSILDANGVAVALSVKTPAVYADPGVLAVPPKVRTWLPDTLGVPQATFRKFLIAQPEVIAAVNNPTRGRVIDVTKRLAAYLRVPEKPLLDRLDAAVNVRVADAARQAAMVLGLPEHELRERLARDERFVWLRRPADEACASQVRALRVRGLCVADEQTRVAAKGLQIGQWLGFVGAEGYGLEGLEFHFERDLAGTPGFACLEHDGRGRRIADSADPTVPPRDGSTLRLTIDSRLQVILDEEIRRVYSEFSPLSVSGIVMDPWTGRILALGSAPGLEVAAVRTMPAQERQTRLRNHPVQSVYEYGSTFKPFVAAVCLDTGVVTPETRINCENGLWVSRTRRLRDHHPYGVLPVTDIIVYSSNIGAAKLGALLGADRLRRCLSLYGFGARTGIELPAEEPGIVTSARRWTEFTTTSVPMGQEIAGTPLQLITAFCALVNGGRLMQPYLVEAIEDPNTGEVRRRTPLERARVIRPETSIVMRRILRQVCERGTAKSLQNAKYPIGGKTGTAQKPDGAGGYSHEKFTSSFVGFAPVDQPKVCVLVMVDEPRGAAYYGAQVAAPAVGRIIDKVLTLLDNAPPAPATTIASAAAAR